MVTAERAAVQRTRQIPHFKPYNGPLPDETHDLSDIDEEEEERRDPQPELEQDRRYPARERIYDDFVVLFNFLLREREGCSDSND